MMSLMPTAIPPAAGRSFAHAPLHHGGRRPDQHCPVRGSPPATGRRLRRATARRARYALRKSASEIMGGFPDVGGCFARVDARAAPMSQLIALWLGEAVAPHAMTGRPAHAKLTDTERLNRLRLIRSDNVGPAHLCIKLLHHFGASNLAWSRASSSVSWSKGLVHQHRRLVGQGAGPRSRRRSGRCPASLGPMVTTPREIEAAASRHPAAGRRPWSSRCRSPPG